MLTPIKQSLPQHEPSLPFAVQRKMASFNTLPYELKLQIAEAFIDISLTEICPSDLFHGPQAGYLYNLRKYAAHHIDIHLPRTKLELLALLELAPETQKDLSAYCKQLCEQAWSQCNDQHLPIGQRDSYRTRRHVTLILSNAVSSSRA